MSILLDFDKYQYFTAQIQIISEISAKSFSLISGFFSKSIFFALFIASSSKSSSLIIFHFLVLIAQVFREINQFPAKNNLSFSIQEALEAISKTCLK
jgi:NADH:ubiquinone oxidoreductase subunit 5 (subunit L)/multisubunit Na+/H+ antiporter MnhA subunit